MFTDDKEAKTLKFKIKLHESVRIFPFPSTFEKAIL